MKGDRVRVEEHHVRVAEQVAALLHPRISGGSGRLVVTIAGESGSGKSETARALADRLQAHGVGAVVLGQDDYFVLPPRSNDARRRADPAWLGPHVEVNMDLLDANLRDAREGHAQIAKPLVDYDANSISQETVRMEGVRVVIAEGTYTSLLRHVDVRIFILRNQQDTLEHRRRRGRGTEAGDPFIEQVLDMEHKIIAGHRGLADIVITRDYDVQPVP